MLANAIRTYAIGALLALALTTSSGHAAIASSRYCTVTDRGVVEYVIGEPTKRGALADCRALKAIDRRYAMRAGIHHAHGFTSSPVCSFYQPGAAARVMSVFATRLTRRIVKDGICRDAKFGPWRKLP